MHLELRKLTPKTRGDEAGGFLALNQKVVAIRDTFSRLSACYRDQVDAPLLRTKQA